jgi:hypothetical protein
MPKNEDEYFTSSPFRFLKPISTPEEEKALTEFARQERERKNQSNKIEKNHNEYEIELKEINKNSSKVTFTDKTLTDEEVNLAVKKYGSVAKSAVKSVVKDLISNARENNQSVDENSEGIKTLKEELVKQVSITLELNNINEPDKKILSQAVYNLTYDLLSKNNNPLKLDGKVTQKLNGYLDKELINEMTNIKDNQTSFEKKLSSIKQKFSSKVSKAQAKFKSLIPNKSNNKDTHFKR